MGDEKLIDQSQLAESISEQINYKMVRHFLVKPLDPIMVKKEFSKPVSVDAKPKSDENGVEAIDYDKVETEVKEVESDYRKGVVLKVPFDYANQIGSEAWKKMPIEIGDIIVYKSSAARYFDLLKDTQLVVDYDIVCVETRGN